VNKKKGTVKWFNDKKGFGFIKNNEGQDVFAHYKDINRDGFKTLTEGETVEYKEEQTDKGLNAVDITPVKYSASDNDGRDVCFP